MVIKKYLYLWNTYEMMTLVFRRNFFAIYFLRDSSSQLKLKNKQFNREVKGPILQSYFFLKNSWKWHNIVKQCLVIFWNIYEKIKDFVGLALTVFRSNYWYSNSLLLFLVLLWNFITILVTFKNRKNCFWSKIPCYKVDTICFFKFVFWSKQRLIGQSCLAGQHRR